MNKVKIDLFNLIKDGEKRIGSWIMVKGKYLNKDLEKLITIAIGKFKSKKKFKEHLENKFGISRSTSERFIFLRKNWHPLRLVREVANLTNSYYKIQKNIDWIKVNKPPLKIYKAVKGLTPKLCKIAGAHMADGTLSKDGLFRITDGYISNIIAFQRWIKDVFGVSYSVKKIGKNEWGIEFHSKVISSYLRRILCFPFGMKQHTVSEPEIVKSASLNFRKSFVLGALTFEAGVGIKHQVELCVSSKAFRDSMAEILDLLNIKFTKMERRSGGYWRLWSNKLLKEEAKKWMKLFEPRTEKWF